MDSRFWSKVGGAADEAGTIHRLYVTRSVDWASRLGSVVLFQSSRFMWGGTFRLQQAKKIFSWEDTLPATGPRGLSRRVHQVPVGATTRARELGSMTAQRLSQSKRPLDKMGGDGHGHDHHKPTYKVPDWRIYKLESAPELVQVKNLLAQKGLKDPWLSAESARQLNALIEIHRTQAGCYRVSGGRSAETALPRVSKLIELNKTILRGSIRANGSAPNEVWRYDRTKYMKPGRSAYLFFFRGFKLGLGLTVLTIIGEKLWESSHPSIHGHDH
uniref:(California timema) hypothetical protein n=1 Tax=Timema californicum TaxID=61474 RepID=A0A7R9JCT0_TIMCA|nr:unnamed protein product [Timema californicum]